MQHTRLSVFVASSVLLLASVSVNAKLFEAHVIHVADGDTVTVTANGEKHRIRLRGVDAPEKDQAYGQQSKKALSWLIDGKDVVIDYNEKDRYGRIVGSIAVGNVDAGLYMLEGGNAWAYRNYLNALSHDWRRAYLTAEQQARANRRGLWQDADPTPPWDYRKAQKGKITRENISNDVSEIAEKASGIGDDIKNWLRKLISGRLFE